MKILPTNLFLNYNKIYFSRIQKKETVSLSKTETLPHIDALTTIAYYKTINNINFGQKLNNNKNKLLDEKIRHNYLSCGKIREFCRNNHISTFTYYTRLNSLDDIEELKEKKQKILEEKNKKLLENILKNHKIHGPVEKFCKENDITLYTYYNVLKKQGIYSIPAKIKYKELDIEIRKNHETGGSVEKFCKNHNIIRTTYFNRLNYGGDEARISIAKRRKLNLEKQNNLKEEILSNYQNKGDIKEFCRQHNITETTYYRHLKRLGIDIKQRITEKYEELDKEIKKHYLSGRQIIPFCKSKGISPATYYKRLRVLGLNLKRG